MTDARAGAALRAAAVTLRPMAPDDWPRVAAIYAEGIATRQATFETVPPTWEQWDANHLSAHRLVAVDDDGRVCGWAAVSAVSDRCAYRGVVESSVYVAASARGAGVGRRLLDELVASTEDAEIWTLQAGIFPDNTASTALHEALGFRVVGVREALGQLDGGWRDVLLLERRSPRVGR